MDSDTAPPGPTMPRNAPFEPAQAAPAEPPRQTADAQQAAVPAATIAGRDERGGVFGQLVTDDSDIAGLVAYSIYKQNKLDWLRAFEAAKGRTPEETELAAYIIGEGTPRRLATYRHLAEATLAGNGPDVDGSATSSPRLAPRRLVGRNAANYASSIVALYGLIAILFIFGFWLALHYTASTR